MWIVKKATKEQIDRATKQAKEAIAKFIREFDNR